MSSPSSSPSIKNSITPSRKVGSLHINYPKYIGYVSLPAAIVFAALYLPFLPWFVFKSYTHPSYVHYSTAAFCALRVTAFVIRAILIESKSAQERLALLIADQVLFAIGFAALLYACFVLTLDLQRRPSDKPSKTLGENCPLFVRQIVGDLGVFPVAFRIGVSAATALGVVAATHVNSNGTFKPSATPIRESSVALFLALTSWLVVRTLLLVRYRISNPDKGVGPKHASVVLAAVCLLLLVREVFVTATIAPKTNRTQYNEHFWYPFVAVPEFLAIVLFTTPGLVPTQKELDLNSPA